MQRREFLKTLPVVVGGVTMAGMLRPVTARAASPHGVAATVHPLATKVALDTLKKGGNAVDAAIAAGLMLGVVDGFNSGIGGGCFLVIRRANGEVAVIDGREMAPSGATRDMYVKNGKAMPELSLTGPLASGVPGELAAFDYAQKNYGKLKLADVILPAAEIAEKGFRISQEYADRLNRVVKDLALFPASKEIFLKANGSGYKFTELLKQADLAKTYRTIGEQGVEWFYKGEFAKRAAEWMKANGGIITAEDFADYQPKLRDPLRTKYRDYEIVGMPPPSSGGVHVAQILNILEHFNLVQYGPESLEMYHLIIESMKLAFADRAWWLGDPDFVSVPRGLVSKAYAQELALRVNQRQAGKVEKHSVPPNATTDIFRKHTTHFTVADGEGNWVACTATINTTFGSKVVVPGTGVVLNNEMDDFSIQPGVPNSFGLLGNEANAVAPGKRPLSSMSPTIVLKNGQPVFSVGAAGGPTIISQVLLALVRYIDFGFPPSRLLEQPNLHHQWNPDEVKIEAKAGPYIMDALKARGHTLKQMSSFGACQAIARTSDGQFQGAGDPRVNGKADVL
ncbi:MAG TPA: gamma-glutamyltransferase [Verrucomicrobiae bacterium]